MKIVFLDASTLADTDLGPIAALGELVAYATSTAEEARERVKDCDVLIINKVIVDRGLLQAAPRLKLVCESGTGINNINTDDCEAFGIPVRNVAGYSTSSVVQHAFMHLLSLCGSAPWYDDFVKSGEYSRSPIFTRLSQPIIELDGKTIGIIGMGTIGRKMAQVSEAFGMKVQYYSTSGTKHCTDYPAVELEQLLKTSDVVSIHAPLNSATRGLIGARELSLMKSTAYLLNLGRGSIVDEKALADAISSESIAGAALDVFSREPIDADNPLLHTKHPERLRFTPHTAWGSTDARDRLVKCIAEHIRNANI
ncbi:MAG: D-2-hydroxyacid dehydrogenase [Bacteroidales bacterium]|nr:D-2-hydroxyacid dehydrogenase [Bacteroidales bacterium]